MQALGNLTPQQKNVLFYWALGLISVPSLALFAIFLVPGVAITWKVVVLFSIPLFTGLFLLSPPMAFKILDSVLKGIAAIIPKLRETIHKDRRDEDDA
ncbi:MAG: hypothetical protein KAJ42_14330 [Gemmatimonadetes bacterium]|nr:hypothetical protein [Gemmatimonadota bacterium]